MKEQMTDVSTAWRDYCKSRSGEAFEKVVNENLQVVYSAALRKANGDLHFAKEITQAVFSDIASRPQIVPENAVLAGWLYRHTCFKASQTIREAVRRRLREKTAAELQAMDTPTNDQWESISPLLDELMEALKENERDALVLRYFKQADLKTLGATLNISEAAAQKRVSRALETLRGLFMQRGIATSGLALAATLEANAVAQMPVHLLTTLTAAGIASQKALAPAILSKIVIMKTSAGIAVGLVLIGTISALVLKRHSSVDRGDLQNVQPQPSTSSSSITAASEAPRTQPQASISPEVKLNQSERLELMRLRSEVGQLRREKRAQMAAPFQNAHQGSDSNSLEHILRVLSDNDSNTSTDSMRYDAAQKLQSVGPEAVEAIPSFLDLLRSDTEAKRYAGARALVFISERSPEAFQHLSNALQDSRPEVRDAATHGLGLLLSKDSTNVNAVSAMPTILQNLEDVDKTVRADTIQTLRSYIDHQHWSAKDGNPGMLVPRLIQRLSDEYSYARVNAAMALGSYGPKASTAAPYLKQLLQDPDEQVRRVSAEALARIEQAPPSGGARGSDTELHRGKGTESAE